MRQSGLTRLIGSCAACIVLMLSYHPARSERSFAATTKYENLLQPPQPGTPKQQYMQSLRTVFIGADADGDGQLTQRDVDLHGLIEEAQARAQSLMVMRYDLDGDGFITGDEIRRAARYEFRSMLNAQSTSNAMNQAASAQEASIKMIETKVQQILALDADKDGKVSFSEATKSMEPRRLSGFSGRVRQFLETNAASKGAVSLAEYEVAGENLFRQIDDDKDGVISREEFADYRARAERVGCEMPKASDNAKVVLLSAYETEALSSVTLGSQENVVHTGQVVVEPGVQPLYIVIPTHAATIWQFSGATERVERLVVTSSLTGPNSADAGRRPLVGATGLDRDRITFFDRPNCLSYFYGAPTSGSLQTAGTVRVGVGKAPEVVASAYEIGAFSVPSGKIAVSRKNGAGTSDGTSEGASIGPQSDVIAHAPSSRAKQDLRSFSPGGVIEIDPAAVVGSDKASSYEVLPQQGGLVQLLQSGGLVQNSNGEYIVKRKIRFPSGLHGAHSVTFLVLSGVPYPDGDPGHSCVVVEDTGMKKGSGCRN